MIPSDNKPEMKGKSKKRIKNNSGAFLEKTVRTVSEQVISARNELRGPVMLFGGRARQAAGAAGAKALR